MNDIHLDPKMVPAAMRGAYNGQKFTAVVCTETTIPSDAGLWDGGSRDTFYAIEMETGAQVAIPGQNSAPWDNGRADRTVALRPGFALVRRSMFRGKDMGMTFYLHPDNAAKLLPAPAAELTAHESLVLSATCSYKASYGGMNRYEMAKRDCEYNPERKAAFPTIEQWETAKQSLIAKGLLNKAGAVTVAGRNARPAR